MMVIVFNFWQLILKGGPMMWPILVLSMVALAVGMERIKFLSSAETLIKEHKSHLMRSLRHDGIKKTLTLCESYSSAFSRMFKAGILRFGNSSEVIRTSMEEVLVYEIHRLKERMSILSFIMNASVLVGLLGTVIGLTVVFHAISARSNVLNPLSVGEMSAGIWQALFTTIAGLVVGIFSYSFYSFCVVRINNVIADLQLSMVQTLQALVQLAEFNQTGKE
ncbi:MAG: MotA/TolQ/ExbB proton channel family protein [Candidatus Omnitrophica bacterium]|nr:MotA/TolQ/ExbB proton channel family protein [Candidatus Omnitrophota bacterium]